MSKRKKPACRSVEEAWLGFCDYVLPVIQVHPATARRLFYSGALAAFKLIASPNLKDEDRLRVFDEIAAFKAEFHGPKQ